MSPTQSGPTPKPRPQAESSLMKEKETRKRLLTIGGIIIFLLLAVNVFLLINYFKQDKENTELTTQLDESEQLKNELQKQYYQAMKDLDEQKGRNEELNALIDQQKEELRAQKERIENLLVDKSQLDNARRELRKLSVQVEQYLAEINQLRAENQELAAQNERLSVDKEQLQTTLTSQVQVNEDLSSAKAALVREKQNLEKEKQELSRKVDQASVIKVVNIEAEGQRLRNNGRASRKKFAKSVEQVEICFSTIKNEVVDPGFEEFLVRIISPTGETLAVDNLGSGIFVNQTNNQEMIYTQITSTDYDHQSENLCVVWAPTNPAFQRGDYEVEVYNKGYLAGSTSFTLK